MRDGTGRTIDYMRISITDRCNLRCRYCMPEGIQCLPREEILTYREIEEIAACAADLGIRPGLRAPARSGEGGEGGGPLPPD